MHDSFFSAIAKLLVLSLVESSTSCDAWTFVCKQTELKLEIFVFMLFMMFPKRFCVICNFIILYIEVVICDTLHHFGSLKAAIQYDRELLESEVAKRPHLIMFYAPWYDSLDISRLTVVLADSLFGKNNIVGHQCWLVCRP